MITEYEVVLPTTTIQYLSANIDDITIKPILLFFHGFPECSWAWEKYLQEMAFEYCVIAPDLPGYCLSPGFKSVDEYNIENLIATMADFVKQILIESSQHKLHLVAHDWGGAVAWPLAAFHGQLLHSLTIINAAHPSAFTREMRDNLVQQEKSDYIAGFMRADAASDMQNNNFALFKKLFGQRFFMSEDALEFNAKQNSDSLLSSAQLKHYLRQWNDTETLENMLNYYRTMPQIKTKGFASQQTPLKIPNIRIELPTLVLWGENDSAFVIDNLNGLSDWVPNLRINKIPAATHWVHHEQPAYIMKVISEFLMSLLLEEHAEPDITDR